MLSNLLLGQPPEILQLLVVPRQIGLSAHDTALHEEGLGALQARVRRPAVGLDVVSDRVVSYHPGVHVDAGRLGQGTFSGLSKAHISIQPFSERKRKRELPIA